MLSNEWNRLNNDIQTLITRYQSDLPLKLGELARELGLVVKSATLDPNVSGEIMRSNDAQAGYLIKVNRHENKARQRFTLAHEIAHYLIHKDAIGNGIQDNILYRSKLSNPQEAEANRLAADILMPWPIIQAKLEDYSPFDLEQRIELIANDLGVSLTALQIRLEQHGVAE